MRAALYLSLALACSTLVLARHAHGAETADDLIRKGDVYYKKLQPTEALKYYLPAEKLDPNNAQLLIRIARQYRHEMSDATKTEEKLRLGHIAVDYATRAAALAPNDPEAHLAVAISYGKLMPFEGTKQQFNNSRIIKASADRVIALDPGNDLAWQVLGRWYLAIADVSTVKRALARVAYGTMPTAKYEDAEQCFEKAISLNPNRLMHHIELGRTYIQMGRPEEARVCLLRGLSLPNTERDDPETKKLGRELLKKLN
jgi:tetratricopeptide (TPR) repeat protein